jgi:hypothetical protein
MYPPGGSPQGVQAAVPTVTIKGKTYRLLDTVDQGEFEEPVKPTGTVEGASAGISGDDVFNATDRKLPKTTIADAPVEDFASVAALVKDITTKNSDEKMQKSSGITKKTMTRVAAENRNVRVKGYIHAFKKEGDNDYHVIFGDAPGGAAPEYMNVEVSGLPVGGTAENRKRLTDVRNEFKTQFKLGRTGPGSFKRPHEPIPVQITGSLFWDVDHKPGVVGPDDLKPKTSWEIHPISEIVFLDP